MLRLRLRFALLLALPFQVAVLYVIADGTSAFREFAHGVRPENGASHGMPPFALEQWRWFARDRLRHRLAAWTVPAPPADGPLETFRLAIKQSKVDALDADLPASGRADTKAAVLVAPDGPLGVKVRYIGDNAWHWLFRQKSWRVKVRGGDSWRDRQVFAFKNPPALLAIDEPVACAVAHELDVMAPDVRPVQLFVNDRYAGLYLYWDVADESLLRRLGRMPGSLYSGDGAPPDPRDGVSMLFRDPSLWEKDASRSSEREADRSEIEALLAVLDGGDAVAFDAFANAHLDLDRFARYVAIDRAFGCAHHDYHHNHKLYFDPYRGRFEPILWDISDWGGFDAADRIDAALNPLLVALLANPRIRLRIQGTMCELLRGALAPEHVEALLRRADADTRAARAADAERDARCPDGQQLMLPLMTSRYYGLDEYDAELERTIADYRRRTERLLLAAADCQVSAHWQPAPGHATLDVASHGRVAARWDALELRDDEHRPWRRAVTVRADRNRNGRLDDEDPVVGRGTERIELHGLLAPGLQKVGEQRQALLFGTFDLAPAAQTYRYFVVGDGIDGATPRVACTNALDGSAVAADAATIAPPPEQVAAHPWQLPPAPEPAAVTLGPGPVVIDATRRYGPETTVTIAPGTTLRLHAGASLICRARVLAEGTSDLPIRFEPAEATPWGCFALQGPATAGSRFAHCEFAGGTAQDLDMLQLTGMVNFADTQDLRMHDCTIGANAAGDDAMHWGYVAGGEVTDCTFVGAPSDAFDLDLCRDIAIRGCRFERAGNDGIDLMTCVTTVTECTFMDCGDKGISVGEGSTLHLRDNHYRRCTIGVQVKDGSVVTAATMRMAECGTAVSLYRKNLRYSQGSSLTADALVCDAVPQPVECAPSCHTMIARVVSDGRVR